MKVFRTKSEKETQEVAINFAGRLSGGEVILLYGDLGSGKTVFVKALAKALGIMEVVKSPTFNLMKIYKIPPAMHLCHIDAYRLKDFSELLDIGAGDFLGKENTISVIEWAEKAVGLKAKKIIKINIGHGKNDNERIVKIK
ncbi:MAG: tRNA (adenosine(37)-N6)-threonylcarbamoyltransferase complex ATPase subunit type 1 TsaE [Patescibacteria group bacterium]